MTTASVTFASGDIPLDTNNLSPAQRLIRTSRMLLVNDAKGVLEGQESRYDLFRLIADFIKTETPCLCAGVPGADSTNRYYHVILAFCEGQGCISNPDARACALNETFKPATDLLADVSPAYAEWTESLSVAGLTAYYTSTLASEKLEPAAG